MANRTVKDAKSIRGTNPQFLIEKIIRSRIYECKYWKEECFALSAELIVDKAMELKYVGGVYGGNVKPSPFLCLTLKMLQIQPEKDIIVEFIKNEEFKYVRALGAYYMRLVGTSVECYKYLEPLLNDGRKLRVLTRDGGFTLTHVDEFIDGLLHEERLFDVILPRIQKRQVLEETNELEPRISALEDDENENEGDSSGDERDGSAEKMGPPPAPQMTVVEKRKSLTSQSANVPKSVDSRSRETRERSKERERPRERDRRDRERERDRERDKPRADKDKHASVSTRRSRSRSRERRHRSRSPERGRARDERDRDRDRARRRDDRDRRQERDYDRRRDRDRANGYG